MVNGVECKKDQVELDAPAGEANKTLGGGDEDKAMGDSSPAA